VQLSIVIPTYNARGTVEPLLAQLAQLPAVQRGEYEVIVTDDRSTDGFIALLRRQGWLHIVKSHLNTGFGSNVNRGVSEAAGRYLAIVNTDIELLGDVFGRLVQALDQRPQYFALMPLVFNTSRGQVENLQELLINRGLAWNADTPATSEFTRRMLAWRAAGGGEWEQGVGEEPLEAILCGACFVCRADRFRRLGGFSHRYRPFYWEDVDLGFYAGHIHRFTWREPQGWKVGTLPGAAVLHRHSESIDKEHGARKLRFLRLNQLRFCLRWREELQLPNARMWYWLRGVREGLKGDPVLKGAYFKAASGQLYV
jgi:GT2 family glycosyltransferase